MAGRAVVAVVGHNNVHFVVAVGEQPVEDPREHPGAQGRERFVLHGPADAEPSELAAVPPEVHLGRRESRLTQTIEHTFTVKDFQGTSIPVYGSFPTHCYHVNGNKIDFILLIQSQYTFSLFSYDLSG